MREKPIPHICMQCGHPIEEREQLRDLAVAVVLLALAQAYAWLFQKSDGPAKG